jgi:hypothetical protein
MSTDPNVEHEPVDPLGPEESWADFRPMILYLMVTGAVLTVAAKTDDAWAYVVGLVLTAGWVLGFVVSRNRPERWFIW